DAVDAAGRGAGDHVDDNTGLDAVIPPRLLPEQLAVHRFGAPVRARPRGPQRRPEREAVDLLRHPVHVDGKRRASVTNEREPELLLIAPVRQRPPTRRRRGRSTGCTRNKFDSFVAPAASVTLTPVQARARRGTTSYTQGVSHDLRKTVTVVFIDVTD